MVDRADNTDRDKEATSDLVRLMEAAIQTGGTPLMVITAKPFDDGRMDYAIATMLPRETVEYILGRVLGLIDGSIEQMPPHSCN